MEPRSYFDGSNFTLLCTILQTLMNLSDSQKNPIAKKFIEDMIDSAIELLKYYK